MNKKVCKKKILHVSEWQYINSCIHCETVLNEHEIFHSAGICPHCGFGYRNGYPILKYKQISRRWIRTVPWWKLWISKKGYWQYVDRTLENKEPQW